MLLITPKFKNFTSKVVFYGIPQNASSCMHKHLGFASVAKQIENEIKPKIASDYTPFFCLKAKDFKKLATGINVSDYFSFSVVRDPWDRAFSIYKSAISAKKDIYGLKGVSFLRFCEILHENKKQKDFIPANSQFDWINASETKPFILRFEDLHNDFDKMVKKINLLYISPNLPLIDKVKSFHYSNYYESKSIDIISKVFEKDIDNFEYSFIAEDPDSPGPRGSKGSLRI